MFADDINVYVQIPYNQPKTCGTIKWSLRGHRIQGEYTKVNCFLTDQQSSNGVWN